MACDVGGAICLHICGWCMYMLRMVLWFKRLILLLEDCGSSYMWRECTDLDGMSSRGWVADKDLLHKLMLLLQLLGIASIHCIFDHVLMILKGIMLLYLIYLMIYYLLMMRMFMLLSLCQLCCFFYMIMLHRTIWSMVVVDNYLEFSTKILHRWDPCLRL